MTIAPFALLLLAVPVLLVGELVVARAGWLRRSHIPPPVISGLVVALLVLTCNQAGRAQLTIREKTDAQWWTWLVLPEVEWAAAPAVNVYQPLLIGFFTCIGLNASWAVARKGSWQLVVYLAVAAGFAVIQNATGLLTAVLLGERGLLGVMCSGVSLMGGFGTAAGFAGDFEKAGLSGAATIGTASAAFGVIAGSILSGPTGRLLVERHVRSGARATSRADEADGGAIQREAEEIAEVAEHQTFVHEVAGLLTLGRRFLVHLLILLACIKAGAWVYYAMRSAGLTFPIYIGAMLVGVTLRNLSDLLPRPAIDSDVVDRLASVCLSWLLAAVIMSLNLTVLANAAGPMLVILVVQVVLQIAFAYWVVFRLMGADYEAATMSVGMIGFGLGATSNAVATMKQMTRSYGPAPRAFLIVTVVGAFLIDFANSIIITVFLNWLK